MTAPRRIVETPGELPYGLTFRWDFAASTTNPTQVISKQITRWPWQLRAICLESSALPSSIVAPPQVIIQIQLPDGRFLEDVPEDVASMAGYGSWRRALNRQVLCPVGSKVSATLEVTEGTASVPQQVGILLEGAYKLKPSRANQSDPPPRYVPGANQNIMAPVWVWGQGPQTPDGYKDDLYAYLAPVITVPVVAAPAAQAAQTVSMRLPFGESFRVRRLLFFVVSDAGPPTTGTFVMRIRAASGYALMDDFIDGNFLCGAPWACDWALEPGEQLFFDAQLLDITGGGQPPGNMYLLIYLEGVRRRPK
jgi:hypothetical protein